MDVKEIIARASATHLLMQKTRLEICSTCESRVDALVNLCSECGCILKLKTIIPSQECPLGKWKSS